MLFRSDTVYSEPNRIIINQTLNHKLQSALRAVVELHKPKSSEYFEEDVCETCSFDLDYYILYPCSTIEAIEKELM